MDPDSLLKSEDLIFDDTTAEIHLRIKQRTKKKSITYIEGIKSLKYNDKEIENLTKKFRTSFNCSAALKKDVGVIIMQGDHRDNIKNYLIKNNIVKTDQIKIHGF